MRHIDILSYSLLLFGIGFGVFAFLRFRFDTTMQLLVILALVIFYLLWGLLYHFGRKDLDRKLFLEYLLIALICMAAGVLVFWL